MVVYDRRQFTVLARLDTPFFNKTASEKDTPKKEIRTQKWIGRHWTWVNEYVATTLYCMLEVGLKWYFFEVERYLDNLSNVCLDWKIVRFKEISKSQRLGIVTTGDNTVCVLPFKFQNIITERWNKKLFFVQGRDEKWGAYRILNNFDNVSFESVINILSIEPFVPLEYDAISEAELEDTCAPITYWILHKDDKIGIMTEFAYTPAVFDFIKPIHEDWAFCFVKGNKHIKLDYYDIERAVIELQ
ncbi:MAG: hypothetical protein Q4F07_09500 [Bacteroidales bacterium]|nr:hypothetical protein [Bacteroidales bacterium]